MSFYQRLQEQTSPDRGHLLSAPILSRCMAGDIEGSEYLDFLTQAYHHVRHTVPLLQAVAERLPGDKAWLQEAVAEYIEEEEGHDIWILDDIAAAGGDAQLAAHMTPDPATELMVAYAYDMVQRVNPLGFFGMVQVLEGTSIALADNAATAIQTALGLPDDAFGYLRSHGALDQDHVKFFQTLMDRITEPAEQHLICHAAKMFYHLYGDIFRSLNADRGLTLAMGGD